MARVDRVRIIQEIEEQRGSKVISFILGDRTTLETKIHSEVLPKFYDLLSLLGENDRHLDLFIYSVGGITTAAWGIANLLNEFCSCYSVLVPYKAFSAATLICLGAKEIVMTKLGQLSPVDPSVNSPFNPPAPGMQNQVPMPLLPVPVEDCVGYLNFVKEGAGISQEEGRTRAFIELVSKVHPLALGNVFRAREQIKMLSEKLLSRNNKDPDKINLIVQTLTKDLYSHDYIIGRTEAQEIGLPVKINEDTERIMIRLFDLYMNTMELTKPFNAEIEKRKADSSSSKTLTYYRAFLESGQKSYAFVTERKYEELTVTRPGIPFPEKAIKQQVMFEGWREENE